MSVADEDIEVLSPVQGQREKRCKTESKAGAGMMGRLRMGWLMMG